MQKDSQSTRRSFFRKSALAASASLLVPSSIVPAAPHLQDADNETDEALPEFRIGLAAFSFRSHFAFKQGKPQPIANGKEIDMFGFVDYCAEQHCAAELTSYFFPPDANRAYFHKLKRHAFMAGVPIVGTAIGNNFTLPRGEKLNQQIEDAKKWIERAVWMGAPHVRFFAGTKSQLEASEDAMEIAVESLNECAKFAADHGVMIGVENHGKVSAEQLLKIVDAVGSEWVGISLDGGNFVSNDPYGDFDRCSGHSVNVQLKVKVQNAEGKKEEADLARQLKSLKDKQYHGYVVLEYEEANPFDDVPGWLKKLRMLNVQI